MAAIGKYGIVILAAGNSSRLGRPKQLLSYHNKTLIRRITEAAIHVAGEATLVVTGSSADFIATELADLPCSLCENPKWQTGMGTSIAAGVARITEIFPSLTHILITVCDQPFVNAVVFREIVALAVRTSKGIVASSYAETVGVPVLFSRQYFDTLQNLTGPEGAKKLANRFPADVALYNFPAGCIDIDTDDDYQKLLDQQ